MENSRAVRLTYSAVPGAVRLLLLADITMAALYILDTALGHPYWSLTRLVDLDQEANIPTWYSSSQILILALLLGVFVFAKIDRRAVKSWTLVALPALCLALSLDETAQIHEWFGNASDRLFATGSREGSLVPRTGLWMFLLGPPFLMASAVLWRALLPLLRGRKHVVRLYLAGFFVYAASALGTEVVSNAVTLGGLPSSLQVLCEELGEMLGVTLLVWATLELLASYDIHVRVGNDRAA